jgi:mannose-6-phosphate isomerase-like protein (cupin superfamily)
MTDVTTAPFAAPFPPAGAAGHAALLTADNARHLRAGVVTLAPGEGCGAHSTEGYEELLLILAGEGEVRLEGFGALRAAAGACYIPPGTTHEVVNTGREPLRYVYVVAPAA